METIFATLTPTEKEHLLNAPALASPPGIVPNFTDPPNRLPLCIGLTVASITVSALVVILRLYTRVFCLKKLRLEDCKWNIHTLVLPTNIFRFNCRRFGKQYVPGSVHDIALTASLPPRDFSHGLLTSLGTFIL